MNQNTELADAFLRQAHPTDGGWASTTDVELQNGKVDYLFQKDGQYHVVVIKTAETYVSKAAVAAATELYAALSAENPSATVKVILAYDILLIPPARLPKGVVVVSMSEDIIQSNDQKMPAPCNN